MFGVVVSFAQNTQVIPGNLDLANATATFTSSEGNVADGTVKLELLSSAGNYTANIKKLKVESAISTSVKNVVVERNNKHIYTIDGRRMSPSHTSHGLYIIDGKKVVR